MVGEVDRKARCGSLFGLLGMSSPRIARPAEALPDRGVKKTLLHTWRGEENDNGMKKVSDTPVIYRVLNGDSKTPREPPNKKVMSENAR